MSNKNPNRPTTVAPAVVIKTQLVERNGSFFVEDEQGNIVGQDKWTDEQKAQVAAAKEAKAATAAAYEKAGAQEEQKPEAAPAEATPVVAVAAPTLSTVPEVPMDAFELPLSASSSSRLTIQELKDYIGKMSAGVRMAPAEGGQAQTMLYHVLIQAINTRAEEFDIVFGLVMKLIRANIDTVFSDEKIHRYTPHVALPSAAAANLRYLINALTALADPSEQTRKIAKRQINIDQALSARQIKEDARQRVLAYFHF